MTAPVWVTFYSARGGVGRTTLLSLCALELARGGKRVLVADFDLESPGLDIVFDPSGRGHGAARAGVVDFLAEHLSDGSPRVEDFVTSIELPGDFSGRLFLLRAGACDDEYLAKLDRLDLRTLYQRSGLFNPVRALRAEVSRVFEPDVILVDSRTGYSDAALVTLFDFANVVVTVLVPDLQNAERLVPVLRRIASAPKGPRTILVANKCSFTMNGVRAIADIEDRLRDADPARGKEPLDEEERPFLHKITFESSYLALQRMLPPPQLLEGQRRLVEDLRSNIEELLTGGPDAVAGENASRSAGGVRKETLVDETSRSQVLQRLPFEEEDYAEKDVRLLEAFFFAGRVDEALRPDRSLIRGRKGAGKSAIFRLLTEERVRAVERCPPLAHWDVVAGHGEQQQRDSVGGYLLAVDLQLVSGLVADGSCTWPDLWRLYAVARLVNAGVPNATTTMKEAAKLLWLRPGERPDLIRTLLHHGSHAWYQILEDLVSFLGRPTLLVYDHLDAGFGSAPRDLKMRSEAVTGLLQTWSEDLERFGGRLAPKILLREDVYSTVALANINRWSSRDVELRWEPDELLACVTQRAKLDPEVRRYLEEKADAVSPEVPSEYREFVLIFDERVRPRAKQARTWLTVLSRLQDANRTRFPRDFLRLGAEAKALELSQPGRKRYRDSALIAGEHSVAALKRVSARRNEDLRDEFPRYVSLLDGMRGLRSPVLASELLEHFEHALTHTEGGSTDPRSEAQQALDQLKAFGVIGDWKPEGDAARLFVPDLYLHGLGMYRAGW